MFSVRDLLKKLQTPEVGHFVDNLGTRGGQQAAEAFSAGLSGAAEDAAKRVSEEVHNEIPRFVNEARKHIKDAVTEEVFDLARKGAGTAAVGALTGAISAPGDRRSGALRGGLGGLGGGLVGAALGKKFGVNPVGARIGGAALGGASLGYLGNKEQPMHKYAGVVLDFHDDGGQYFKSKFPNPEKIPSFIKEARLRPKEQMPEDAFALIAHDNGRVLKKYACVDAGTTAISVMYLLENHHKLPEEAVKTAASNLYDSCVVHGLLPPVPLSKLAMDPGVKAINQGTEAMTQSFGQAPPVTSPPASMGVAKAAVDLTGKTPKTKIASGAVYDEDYALIVDGKRMYPIHDWNHVKEACDYWASNSRRMEPSLRRQFAVKVASKAHQLGYPITDATLLDAGAPDYAYDGHVKMAMEMRKIAMPGEANSVHREFLDELIEKRASMHPEVFAECVRQFDVMNGLDSGWGRTFLDPWESTFGVEKVAKVIWEDGPDRLTENDLINLSRNYSGSVDEYFSEGMVSEFERNPVAVFNSMPLPQKKILARLATDMARQGRSSNPDYME